MKIVATIDFSTASEPILRITKLYAEKMGAEVFLIHAEPLETDIDAEDYDAKPEAMRLKRDAQALERAGIKVTHYFLKGPVCETILAKAIKLEADLVITGAHGHGNNCKFSIGHISECILLKSKIPVRVVP